MQLYAGIDLHSNNNYLGIIDDEDHRVFKHLLPNSLDCILCSLKPFKRHLEGIVVESSIVFHG